MMRRNQKEKWYTDIQAAMANFRPALFTTPALGQVNAVNWFPLTRLQAATDYYLAKKGRMKADERDRRLKSLIMEYPPPKELLIAACAHVMSTEALREIIIGECRVDHAPPHEGLRAYLVTIAGAHYANPEAIKADEEQLAQALIVLLPPEKHTAIGQHLNVALTRFFSLSTRGEPSEFYTQDFVELFLRNACINFSERLDVMRSNRQWKLAHEESSWLSEVPGESPTIGHLLSRTFSLWRVWAMWRPNMQRLARWEHFTSDQRRELWDVLGLEGPDFIAKARPTMREGIISLLDPNQPDSSFGYGKLVLQPQDGSAAAASAILDRLLDALDAAQDTSPEALYLFTQLCTRHPVNDRTFRILELVNAITDTEVPKAVLSILTAGPDVGVSAAIQLLPALNDGPGRELREILTPDIIGSVQAEVQRMQNVFCEQLQRGGGDGVGMHLHMLGETLSNATWLQPSLTIELQSVLETWPERSELETLFKLRKNVQHSSREISSPLPNMINSYLLASLAGRGEIDNETRNTFDALAQFWQQRHDPICRDVALAIAQRSTISSELRIRCLAQLKEMQRDFVSTLDKMLKKDTDMACVNFASFLASHTWESSNTEAPECWRGILLSMIRQRNDTLLDSSLKFLNVKSWFQFLADVKHVFGDSIIHDPPDILNPALHRWSKRLTRRYTPTLAELEDALGSLSQLDWIVTAYTNQEPIIALLNVFQNPDTATPARTTLLALSKIGSSSDHICEAISRLPDMTADGIEAYLLTLEVCHTSSRSEDQDQDQNQDRDHNHIAQAVLTVWLGSPSLSDIDRSALQSLASMLGLQAHLSGNELRSSLRDISKFIDRQYEGLLDEASRLESIRLGLKAHDPARTSALLKRLGIEDLGRLEDSNAGIPKDLVDVIEGVGDGEYEMVFLLSHLKPLNMIAHGLSDARMLVVRLKSGYGGSLERFCMHIFPEQGYAGPDTVNGEHTYHKVSRSGERPDTQVCYGRANRVTYQLSRILYEILLSSPISLELIYRSLRNALDNLAQICVVCGSVSGRRLWRSTTCRRECSSLLQRSDLEVRLVDLRLDPPVVDLLLSSVHAAAVDSSTSLSTLLPGCPVTNAITLRQVIHSVPDARALQNAPDLSMLIRGLAPEVEALLSWVCTSYRGFVATATEALKIPSMPGVHQFVVASSAPALETAFARQVIRQRSSRVVFHGTSLDRVYAILRQGLKVLSGGPLQRHGSAMGSGIYMSEEPAIALDYSGGTSSGGWRPASSFQNIRVLLACELAGSTATRNGIHVVSDSSTVMVRYVFLFPDNATAPIAAHVVPALTSAFAMLRLRSV